MRKLTQAKPKIIILLLLVSTILLGGLTLIGCSPNPKKAMMSYMEKKYGEEFTFVNIGTQLWERSYIEMILTSDNIPEGEYITVHMDKKSKSMSDDYVSYLMQTQVEEYLSKLAEPIYGPTQVFSLIDLMPAEAVPGMDMEEYVKLMKHKGDYSFYVGKDTSTRDEDLEMFRAALEGKECAISLGIIYLTDISLIGEISDEERKNQNWQDENITITSFFVMDDNYQISRPDNWREMK